MQITKEIINNTRIQSRFYETLSSMRSHLTMSKLKTILLVSLISFTSLLVRQTLQVQHSCNPMIHWTGELPTECEMAIKADFKNYDNFSSQAKQELITPKQQPQIAPQLDRTSRKNLDVSSAQPLISQNTVKPLTDKATSSPKATEPEITQVNSRSEPEDLSNSVGQFVNEHSNDIVGGIAGVAGGVATVAAASATAAFSIPVAGAVAIGFGIWFLIRSAL
ncbi:hypothetical protein [Myxosarcina sp. GI1]|uniref:hypothetical protein n=1 Tax=Myxosarcina sp. GI1 TaxID=1541065 RepID=UPI0012E02180|nr:hypothetical protein [Myxosarcina sp. GI1]